MKRVGLFAILISIPLLLIALAWQAGRFDSLAAEARKLEASQESWVQENRKLEAGIRVLSSRERAAALAQSLGLELAGTERRLRVILPGSGEGTASERRERAAVYGGRSRFDHGRDAAGRDGGFRPIGGRRFAQGGKAGAVRRPSRREERRPCLCRRRDKGRRLLRSCPGGSSRRDRGRGIPPGRGEGRGDSFRPRRARGPAGTREGVPRPFSATRPHRSHRLEREDDDKGMHRLHPQVAHVR